MPLDDDRPGLSGILPEILTAWLTERGHPGYRARQVADALWRGHARDAASILTLPAELRAAIDAAFRLDTVGDTEVAVADGGRTEKFLHRLAGDATVESVLMHYQARAGSRAVSRAKARSRSGSRPRVSSVRAAPSVIASGQV